MDWRKLLAAAILAVATTVSASAQQTNCDSEASFGRSDGTLFGRYCAVCHSISGQWNRIVRAPLGGLFERKQLVTGQSVSEETVRELIAKGGPSMPGFQYTLTPAQISEMVQFLKAARCPEQGSASPAGR